MIFEFYWQQSVVVDAQFLLSKVNFMLRDYEETLRFISIIEQDTSNFDGSRRRLKMVADMFAIKGTVLYWVLVRQKVRLLACMFEDVMFVHKTSLHIIISNNLYFVCLICWYEWAVGFAIL